MRACLSIEKEREKDGVDIHLNTKHIKCGENGERTIGNETGNNKMFIKWIKCLFKVVKIPEYYDQGVIVSSENGT